MRASIVFEPGDIVSYTADDEIRIAYRDYEKSWRVWIPDSSELLIFDDKRMLNCLRQFNGVVLKAGYTIEQVISLANYQIGQR